MTQDCEVAERSSPLLVTRRAVITGALMAAAAPAAMARMLSAERSAAVTGAVDGVSPLVRQFHTTTETGMGTVAAGGYRFGPLSAVQIYDGQKWHDAPPMLRPRYQHVAVPYGQGVLVMGGLSIGGSVLSDAEYFDGSTWTRIAPMNTPRSLAAALVHNGFPMVTGGRYAAPLSSVEVFDGQKWQRYPSLITPRFGHDALVVNGMPTVKGGAYIAPLSTTESFNGTAWSKQAGALQSSQ